MQMWCFLFLIKTEIPLRSLVVFCKCKQCGHFMSIINLKGLACSLMFTCLTKHVNVCHYIFNWVWNTPHVHDVTFITYWVSFMARSEPSLMLWVIVLGVATALYPLSLSASNHRGWMPIITSKGHSCAYKRAAATCPLRPVTIPISPNLT